MSSVGIWRSQVKIELLGLKRACVRLQTINRMPDADGVPAKKMEAMQIEGYLPTAKANLELTDALDKIKVGPLTHVYQGVSGNFPEGFD